MKILVVNCGSSSIKYQLFEMPEAQVLAKGVAERIGEQDSLLWHRYQGKAHRINIDIADHEHGMTLLLEALVDKEVGVISDITEITAVGHRVVHGGEEFTGSVEIDDAVISSIEEYSDLAPLHNPANLTGIRASMAKLPETLQVACFDTAFHATIPQVAYTYALPWEIYEKYRVRRYGFHGTSHRYVARRAAEMLGSDKYAVNLITCHLGNGCSITAVRQGRSVDTSMGLTPLEGVIMGTRCGDIDPAILFYLNGKGYSMDSLQKLCNKESGLLGISGVSNDMRNLTEMAADGNERAKLAVEMFCYRIKKYIGAYAASLDTVDAVVFTGGIGENSAAVRSETCKGLSQIGIELDEQANHETVGIEGDISTGQSRVKVLVVPTDEEGAIARDTYKISQRQCAGQET